MGKELEGRRDGDGEVVELDGAESRRRNRSLDFLIITPRTSIIAIEGMQPAEDTVQNVYDSLVRAGDISVEILEPLRKIQRGFWRVD